MSDQITVSGGGSVAVETPVMLAAAAALGETHDELQRIDAILAALRLQPAWAALDPALRARADGAAASAAAHCRVATRTAGATADAVRTAAVQYGAVEHLVVTILDSTTAGVASIFGGALRLAAAAGPLPLAVTAGAELQLTLLPLLQQTIAHTLTTGRFEPQLDPMLLAEAQRDISSADDLLRGFLLIETPQEIARNDPGAPFGTEAIAGALGFGYLLLEHPDPRLRLQRSGSGPMPRPTDLADLGRRVPQDGPATPQLRIERYADGDGAVRWIVYSSGTVHFAPVHNREPFDMLANLQGVADEPSAAQTATVRAMHAAGIRPGQPVLLVGHSQGALNLTRVAADGGFDVAGVVTLGGPTGQIALPRSLPVLALEHDEDPVPVIAGIPAAGAAGLNRVVVRRRLYDDEAPPSNGVAVPSHETDEYVRTLLDAERSSAAPVAGFQRQTRGFFTGDAGTVSSWQASRATGDVDQRRPRPATSGRFQ
ncbi:hypothetical protein [uncultured Amnibacterium sp.]|uniref:hypothetical protein n=1 Tax=uncultured Amnibacterium sp. TaxID=1631851 RepID=UPI0035CA2A8A